MKKLFNYVIVHLLSLAGIGTAVAFTSTKESSNSAKIAHALPEGLVDTYDVVTLSDITQYAGNTFTGAIDLTNPDNDGFFHKSSTNTTGSVVFKFKQLIPTYANTSKTINVVLRGTNYYENGFEFYHTDNNWRSVQIRVKNEDPDKREIAEWWGGASGNIFKDNVIHEVEVGAINYANENKIYCYYMLDGALITSADYENSKNYDFNHPFAGVLANSALNSTLSDSDDHRIVANFSGNSWTTSDEYGEFLFLNVNEMANYAAMSNSGFNGWGHFLPSSNATLQYQHANGHNQNLTSLALPFNNAMAINLAYNGVSKDYVENDRLVISGLFRQETSSTNHINAVFSVPETRLIYSKGIWRTEAEYQAALAKAQEFDSKADAIGEVTLDSETAINEARTAYDALSDYEKQLTTKYSSLEAAEVRLQKLKDAKVAAEDVDAKIDTIGEVTLSSETAINEARTAYEALSDEAKGMVTKLATLQAAETRLQELKDAKAAEDVDAKIDAIGKVTLSSETVINEARTSYEALSDEAKGMVTKLATLQAAETELARLKGLKAEAEEVEELIDAIGAVNVLKECREKIVAARTAYNALSEEAEAMVSNYETLTAAETRFDELLAAAKEDGKTMVDNIYASIDLRKYSKDNQAVIAQLVEQAKTAIDEAEDDESIDAVIQAFEAELEAVPQKKANAKKGCGGSVIATSAVLSTLALVGISLLLIKKRRLNNLLK